MRRSGIRNIVVARNPYPECASSRSEASQEQWRTTFSHWLQHAPAGIVGACAALLNAAIMGAAFPSLTALPVHDACTVIALGAGIIIAIAIRFPLTVLVTQSAIFVVVCSIASLSAAAFIAGIRLGTRSLIAQSSTGAAALIIVTTPWLPPGTRLLAPLAILIPFIAGALIHDASQRRQRRIERLQLTLQNAVLMEERSTLRERERIADELHDRLGHRLTAIEIQARLLLEHRATAGALHEKVTIMHSQARRALNDIRAIIHIPVTIDLQTPEQTSRSTSLLWQAKECAIAVGVQAICAVDDAVDALPFKFGYVILRVVQEGLTNAARHAPGQPVQLFVLQVRSGVRVIMTNRTMGVSPDRDGRGLPSLKRRLAQVGGSLAIHQDEGDEFRLEAFLPYPSKVTIR